MTKEGWFQYTLSEQMSNIGAEVRHFTEARKNFRSGKTAEDYSDFYFNKAVSYIDIIEEDPKNARRTKELEDCKKELVLLKEGVFSDEYVLKYWDQYTAACAFRQQRRIPSGKPEVD